MKKNLEQLIVIETETAMLYKQFKPITDDLFPKGYLAKKMVFDENNKKLTELTWGSIEYIEELQNVLRCYEQMREGYERFFKAKEIIDSYNHYNSGIFLKDWQKNVIVGYVYSLYCLNTYSGELKTLIVMNN